MMGEGVADIGRWGWLPFAVDKEEEAEVGRAGPPKEAVPDAAAAAVAEKVDVRGEVSVKAAAALPLASGSLLIEDRMVVVAAAEEEEVEALMGEGGVAADNDPRAVAALDDAGVGFAPAGPAFGVAADNGVVAASGVAGVVELTMADEGGTADGCSRASGRESEAPPLLSAQICSCELGVAAGAAAAAAAEVAWA